MAIYDNLPVFKASYDLLIEVYEMCDKLPREYRHTLGERLKSDITELMIRIYRANAAANKTAIILTAREYIVTIKLYVRLLHDLRQLSVKRYALLAEKAETISKQLTAWSKSVEKKRVESERELIEGTSKAPRKKMEPAREPQVPAPAPAPAASGEEVSEKASEQKKELVLQQ